MSEHIPSFLFTVLLWWVSTGAVFAVCALPRKTVGWSMAGATIVLVASFYGLVRSAHGSAPGDAYVAFLSGIGVWAWLEMSFLTGLVTGPSALPCPPRATGLNRFRLALATVLYHELSIVAAGLVIAALTWGCPNRVGAFTFLILAVMRISAKLNIFLGVPNLSDELLPARLAHLKSYFRKGGVSILYPLSVGGAGIAAIILAEQATHSTGGESVGWALLFTLLSLAILEHLFMILPISDGALWFWAAPARAAETVEGPTR